MPLPVMTPEQREESLRKAAAARAERSRALADLRNGTVTIADVLSDDEHPLQRARIRQVLLAVPGIGPVRADKLIAGAGADARRRVKGLGPRQREQLAALLTAA